MLVFDDSFSEGDPVEEDDDVLRRDPKARCGAGAEEGLGRILLRHAEYSVVVSSGPPEMARLGAARLAERAGLPLVLDFRDPWSLRERCLSPSDFAIEFMGFIDRLLRIDELARDAGIRDHVRIHPSGTRSEAAASLAHTSILNSPQDSRLTIPFKLFEEELFSLLDQVVAGRSPMITREEGKAS